MRLRYSAHVNTPHDHSRAFGKPGAPWSALLDVAGPGGHRTSLPFRPPRVIVGRKRTSDLALPDQGVSSAHCEFVVEAGWFVVRDLASINGTFVNDRRVSEARLRDGDVVRLGATRITVALQGSLRGATVWSAETLRAHWLWVAGAALLLVIAISALVVHRANASAEQQRRYRYAVEVRSLLQQDPCEAIAPEVAGLNALDAKIAGRPVPMAPPGRSLSPALRAQGVELLGLYRAKAEESAKGLQLLGEEQKSERESIDRVGQLAARFSNSQDKKIAFFVQGQLAERLQRGDALLQSFTRFAQETKQFADLVEAVSLRGDASRTSELLAFRFGVQGATDQLTACRTDLARTNTGALGAINGLAEE